jgi:hypothetical protein
LVAPAHWQHAQAHGIFFFAAGLVEIAWSIAYLRKPSRGLTYFGVGMAAMLLALWLLTRALPAPFGHGHEVVDTWAVVCKVSELVGVVALGLLAFQTLQEGTGRRASARTLAISAVLGISLGLLTYVGARAAEPLLPSLAASAEAGTHEHQEESGEAEDHEHNGAEQEHGHEGGEEEDTNTP